MNDTVGNATTSRRNYLAGVAGLAGIATLAGCQGGDSATATGTLATAVKDAPGDISDFESCVVTIEGFWLKESDGDGDENGDDNTTNTSDDGDENGIEPRNESEDQAGHEIDEQDEDDIDQSDGRAYHEYDEPQEADLVQLQDGDTQLIDDRELEVGTYAYLQLDVSGVDGTLSGDETADIGTPGNAPLQFKQAFDVREDQRTTFTADFTPVKRGRTGKYLLQPVASGTDVSYSDESTAE